MNDADHLTAAKASRADGNEDLREALLRVTKPGQAALEANLESLREELLSIADAIGEAEEQFLRRDRELSQEDQELLALIQELSWRQARLEADLRRLGVDLQKLEVIAREQAQTESGLVRAEMRDEIRAIHVDLADPERNAARAAPVLVPLMHQQARDESIPLAEALAPVIGPAIRHQIRNAKQDIIDALYPLIGQIIGKAISNAISELTRSIDARIRQQSSLGVQFGRFYARLKGVSPAELALRDAVPYKIQRVFLIHRETGLLLEHICAQGETAPDDLNVISSMLTAIRDFVRDAFSDHPGELEEISYGDQRILLEAGQNAYLAVALTGVEPQGYHLLIQDAVSKINVDYEKDIAHFRGDVQALPNFRPELLPVLFPEAQIAAASAPRPLTKNQKMAVTLTIVGVVLLLALLAFACVFTVRLWPLVF